MGSGERYGPVLVLEVGVNLRVVDRESFFSVWDGDIIF